MVRLAQLSLHNRALIALVTIVAAVFGVISFANLREELIPNISFPSVVVSATYPGASPQVIDEQVGGPIEQAIQGIDGLETSSSTSQQGSATITAQFAYGTDTLVAEQNVQQAVNRVQATLPDGVKTSTLSASSSDIPIVALAVSWNSDDTTLGQQLQRQTVVDLQSINGVRAAMVSGAPQQQVDVRVSQKKLKKHDITVEGLQQALQASGVVVPAGNITQNGQTISVQAGAQFTSVKQIENVRVSVQPNIADSIPPIALPSFSMPSFSMPSFSLPSFALPSASLPSFSLPSGGALPSGALPTAFPSGSPTIPLMCSSATPTASGTATPSPYPSGSFGLNCTVDVNGVLVPAAKVASPILAPTDRLQLQGLKLPSVRYTAPMALHMQPYTKGVAAKDPFADALKTVRIGDVASVKVVNQPKSTISRVNGKSALTMAVTKTPDANAVSVADAVVKAIPNLQQELGHGAKFTIVFNQAPYIEESIQSLMTEGMLGLAFAVLIILLFLFSWRATLVTAVSIPTSIFITGIGLQAAGYSLNVLTLGAITIAIGRVVDDSIVVVENIRAHAHAGEQRIPAVYHAVKEVAGAITASTLTTVAVFLPLAFVGGLTGELFRPFALTVTIALVASLFVALTIVPVLSYWWLTRPSSRQRTDVEQPTDDTATTADGAEVDAAAHPQVDADATPEPAPRPAQTTLQSEGRRLRRGYQPVLAVTLRHPWLTTLAAVLVFVLSMGLSGALKTDFLGSSGSNSVSVTQSNQPGASLDNRVARAQLVEQAALGTPGVQSVLATVGTPEAYASFAGGGSSGDNSFDITLKASADADNVTESLQRAFDTLTNAGDITVQQSSSSGVDQQIQLTVRSPDQTALDSGTASIAKALKGEAALSNVETSLQETEPLVKIQVKPKPAAQAGLTEMQVAQAVASRMSPTSIGNVTLEQRQLSVYVFSGATPKSIEQLRAGKITTQIGAIKLSRLAAIDIVQTPTTVTSERGRLASTVTVEPSGDNLSTANAAVTRVVDGTSLPAGVTVSVGGVTQDQANSFAGLGIALLIAILIVYTIMVATFKSLLQPLLLLVSIPFAASGVFVILWASSTPLGLAALIGLLMLIGIVVTNAIVLVDLINQYRRDGMSVRESIVEGASRRLRPILMTALATILALTPMALGVTGHSGFISQPLAVVVIGGLVSSTFLTLIVLPVLYWLVYGRGERKRARRERTARVAAQRP